MRSKLPRHHRIEGAMRIACLFGLLAVLAACKTLPRSGFAEIDVDLAPGCHAPSVFFRELRDEKGRNVSSKQMPLRVRPGVYAIGLSCGSIFNSDLDICIEPGENNSEFDVPTYKLILNSKVRYLFSCSRITDLRTYQMVESAL